MTFFIVVPVYNAEPWIEACLRSIRTQKEENWRCLVVDDASTDRTPVILDRLPPDPRIEVVHNAVNRGPLANIVMGFDRLHTREEPDAILTIVDGDDRLAHDQVFSTVRHVYEKNPSCLLTYGSYVREPGSRPGSCEPFPPDVMRRRSYRKYRFVSSHLRTFRSCLWQQLDRRDLRDPETGEFFRAAWDVAIMLPLLEMAGTRLSFIAQTLYVYNEANPLNDSKVRPEEQARIERFVRRQSKYPVYRGQRFFRQRVRVRRALVGHPLLQPLLRLRHAFLEKGAAGRAFSSPERRDPR